MKFWPEKRALLPVVVLACVATGCGTLFATVGGGGDGEKDAVEQTAKSKMGADSGSKTEPEPESRVLDEPVGYAEERVEFESNGDRLAGTLYLPETASAEEPAPAVVILHDWGPMGRAGLTGQAFGVHLPVEVPMYQMIAEHLAAYGVAVLVYDKRTCVRGGPPWCDYPREYLEEHRDDLPTLLVDDAGKAVEHVAARPEVIDDAVFLVGHGHGAKVALAALERPEVTSAVLLAVSPDAIDEQIRHQTVRSIEALEQEIERDDSTRGDLLARQLAQLKEQQNKQRETFRAIRNREDPDDALGLTPAAWRGFFDLHERAMQTLKTTDAPLLIVTGELDMTSPPKSGARLRAGGASRPNVEMVHVPEMTHLLVLAGEGHDSTVVADEVFDAIRDHIASVTR